MATLENLGDVVGNGCQILRGMAQMLNTCLIPAAVVLYFDGACADRWTRWWAPCTQGDTGKFELALPPGEVLSLSWSEGSPKTVLA